MTQASLVRDENNLSSSSFRKGGVIYFPPLDKEEI
jgi:hypothetical protein